MLPDLAVASKALNSAEDDKSIGTAYRLIAKDDSFINNSGSTTTNLDSDYDTITLTINADNYPQETSWKLLDEANEIISTGSLENDVEFLNDFSTFNKRADFAGFIQFDEEDDEIFTFGKYKGRKVSEVLRSDKGYFSWIQNADFPLYTKKVLTEIRETVFPRKTETSLEDLKNKFNQKL